MSASRLWDPREHRRLLASRSRVVRAQWRRVVRALGATWSREERALVELLASDSLDAPRVALAGELEELLELEARLADFDRGDRDALDDLVSHFVDGEHVRELMPRGRLPRDPAPSVKRLIAAIKRQLVARLALAALSDPRGAELRLQLTIDAPRSPSWGFAPRWLVVGEHTLFSRAALPPRLGLTLRDRRFTLTAGTIQIEGEPGGAARLSRGKGCSLRPLVHVSGWPLLPPVVDEDGRSRRRAPYPAAGSAAFSTAIDRVSATQRARIERAMAVLDAAWPEGARTVRDFTRAIIPVTQSEVVSYSFAPVPGWSYVNLFDRDFVDLVDDLVHENAHHHLNHILSDSSLLARARADEPLIYYSPWRETLRPLRGILHSVFTFAAGAELFRRLWRARDRMPHRFSDGERAKIAARCLEETLQVGYTLHDLGHAGHHGRLTARGAALTEAIAREQRGFAAIAPSLRRAISGTRWARRIASLERLLDDRRALSRRLV